MLLVILIVTAYLVAGVFHSRRAFINGKKQYPGMQAWHYQAEALVWFIAWMPLWLVHEYRVKREMRRLRAEAEEYRDVRVRSGVAVSAKDAVDHAINRAVRRSQQS